MRRNARFVAPGVHCWTLIGRVGTGRAVEIGAAGSVSTTTAGRLYLGVNDEFFGDNSGSWSASVEVGSSTGIPYAADWSKGTNGWVGSADWKTLRGKLLNDGTNGNTAYFVPIVAPYAPGVVADYAVETDIRVIAEGDSFGLMVRLDADGGGYAAGVGSHEQTKIDDARTQWNYYVSGLGQGRAFDPKRDWHKYRVEVDGNVITFRVDGAVLETVTDNRYLAGGRVGLWCNGYQLEISSFKVVPLPH